MMTESWIQAFSAEKNTIADAAVPVYVSLRSLESVQLRRCFTRCHFHDFHASMYSVKLRAELVIVESVSRDSR